MATKDQTDEVAALKQEAMSSRRHANNVVKLLQLADTRRCDHCATLLAAAQAVFEVLVHYVENGDLTFASTKERSKRAKKNKKGAQLEKFADWLRSLQKDFLRNLFQMLTCGEPGLEIPALRILMAWSRLELTEEETLSGCLTRLHCNVFSQLVRVICLEGEISEDVLSCWESAFLLPYDDVRFLFLQQTRKACAAFVGGNVPAAVDVEVVAQEEAEVEAQSSTASKQQPFSVELESPLEMDGFASRMGRLLTQGIQLPPVSQGPGSFYFVANFAPASSSHPAQSVGKGKSISGLGKRSAGERSNASGLQKQAMFSMFHHQKVLEQAWLAFMQIPLPESTLLLVLQVLDSDVIPHMQNPVLLMDFLNYCYGQGGIVGMLALKAIFLLMVEHNMDYPRFYHKLYTLLTAEIFHSRFRTRFLSLLDRFLLSGYLPQYLVAAFIKRLLRLSLFGPPQAPLFSLPLVYNLLRKHPNCMSLIHQENASLQAKLAVDPFLADVEDPAASHATESVAWEIECLRQHVLPQVSRFTEVFSREFAKANYDLSQYTQISYTELFEKEVKRRPRHGTPLTEKPPSQALL